MSAIAKKPLSDIRHLEDIDSESLEVIFAHHFNKKKVDNVKISKDFNKFVGTNDNVFGEIHRMSVNITFDSEQQQEQQEQQQQQQQQEVHIVAKSPKDAAFAKLVTKASRPLLKETWWYRTALPILNKKHPILTDITPICYHGYSNFQNDFSPTACKKYCCFLCWFWVQKEESGLLLLQDLGPQGFQVLDKTKVPSFEHANLALTALAHFHGAWWQCLNNQDGEEHFKEMSKETLDQLLVDAWPLFILKKSWKQMFDVVAKLLENMGEDMELVERFKQYGKTKGREKLKAMFVDKKDARVDTSLIKTICHGDFWQNNMLFSYEDDEKPKEVKLIDFQMLTKRHPARDIWFYLYICTDATFRQKYEDVLLRSYYAVYSKYLTGKAARMTYETFGKEMDERRDTGILYGFMVMPTVLSPTQLEFDTWRDFNEANRIRSEHINGQPKDDDHIMVKEMRNRIIDWVREFDKLGKL